MLDGVAVRIKTPTIDRDVSHLVSDLGFTTQAPGGHVQCSFRLNAGYDDFPDLGPMSRVWVTSTSGQNLWGAGYADTPGKGFDGTEGFDLTFKGGVQLAEDESRELLYRDTGFDGFRLDDTGVYALAASASAESSATFPDNGTPAIFLQFNPGQPVGLNSTAAIYYGPHPMGIGAWAFSTRGGRNDSGYVLHIDAGSSETRTMGVGTSTLSAAPVAMPTTALRIRLRRAGGATNISTDDVWMGLGTHQVMGQMLDRFGVPRSMTTAPVLASEVVADLVGRGLALIDRATAEIGTSSYGIDQLTYPDGASAAQVLDDLAEFEPDFFWWIGESATDSGHRFRFVPWPTTPRYELWSDDGIDFPGSESDLCDRVTVFYSDEKDRKQSRTVTLAEKVTAGTATANDFVALERLAGRQRSAAAVTLPDGVGSAANAYAAGVAILDKANTVAQAGRVSIRRKVRDLITGNWLDPAELVSGEVARVADLGTTLRVTETDVSIDASGQENTLTLGTPVRSFVDLLSGQKVHRWALRT